MIIGVTRKTCLKTCALAAGFGAMVIFGAGLASAGERAGELGADQGAPREARFAAAIAVYGQDRGPFTYDQESNPFNVLVGKKRVRKSRKLQVTRVQRYVLSDGERSFLFHDTGALVRIQFLCNPRDLRIDCRIDRDQEASEIYSLLATRAPRGDLIYKDIDGNTVLRIASYGGATVWWPGENEARAASRSFSDRTHLRLPMVSARMVERRASRATALLSALTGEPIEFDTGVYHAPASRPPAARSPSTSGLRAQSQAEATLFSELSITQLTPGSRQPSPPPKAPVAPVAEPLSGEISVLADAIMVVAKGMATVAADPTGARIIGTRVKIVRFIKAQAPSMGLDNQVFEISYNPARGLHGRPTSAEIARFLENNL